MLLTRLVGRPWIKTEIDWGLGFEGAAPFAAAGCASSCVGADRRVALLERQLSAAFRSRQKASLKGRTQLEPRLSELHEEKLAKLDGLRHAIDPALIREAIDRLSENESRVRDELSRMNREPDEQSLLTSVSRLRQAGPCGTTQRPRGVTAADP